MDVDEAQARMQEIQRIMERATLFTLLPGMAAVIGGVLVLAGCAVSYAMFRSLDFAGILHLSFASQAAFCAMWFVIGVIGVLLEVILTTRAAARQQLVPANRPMRVAAFSLTPSVVVAMVLIIVCGTLLNGQKIEDAAIAARVIMPQSKFIGTVMAIGLFDAGLLGAVCISLASSWAFGEVFGWAHSLNQKIKEAPWFYAYYFFDLLLAGTVVLIPNAPLVLITMFVQVIATTLLPAALVFLILLLNDKKTMGGYVNSLWENIANISIVVGIIVMSTLYGISALFPEAFSDPRGAWNDTGAYLLNLHWTPANMTLAILAAVAVGVAAGMWWSGRRLPLDVLERWFLYRICGSAGRTIGALAVTGATVTWDLYRIKAVLPDLLSHPRQAWNETIAGFQGLGWTPANVALAVLVAVLAAALVGVFMGRSWLAHLGRGMAAFLARSRFARFFRLTRGQVREVNRRYARPEIETTLLAKTCLVGLRVYLVLLVVLMVFKFITAALQG